MSATNERLTSEDRREQILAAASDVFGERGFAGGTTDAIAKVAGVSQAYVVRMFGSKQELFIAATERACERVIDTFRAAIAELDGEETVVERLAALGRSYVDLIADRGTLLTMMHAFTLGHDPRVGPLIRERYLDIYRFARDEAGLGPEVASHFLATGMLINTGMAMRLPDIADSDDDARELLGCLWGDSTDALVAMTTAAPILPEALRR
ncbi:TetR/AcrR family transcriptional regulator [Demequina salsinemoris]|uniref:TetR/AcrR family transcriptional regulator n=1 Tax=Demequina salsinemoris TaxID=577470 RepID=UPI000783318D|nr:TetR/AcrR family transcriptional regulator [Demequina salsinemoris]